MSHYADILPDVLAFATFAHKGQVRKYTGEAYINHPIHVAGLVSTVYPRSELARVLAILHDTIEDTRVTYADILQRYGIEVAEGVELLTKDEPAGWNREKKLTAYRIKLSTAPEAVQVVKACDMVGNMSSIAVHDPKYGVVYGEEKLQVLDVMRNLPAEIYEWAHGEINDAIVASQKAMIQQALGKKEGKL